jgi:hypothetical protein
VPAGPDALLGAADRHGHACGQRFELAEQPYLHDLATGPRRSVTTVPPQDPAQEHRDADPAHTSEIYDRQERKTLVNTSTMTTTQRTTDGTTMQAITQDRYGEAEDVLRLEEIARPAIGDEEVLLRVHAAGVDRASGT